MEPPPPEARPKGRAGRYPPAGKFAAALLQAAQAPASNQRVWQKDGKVMVRVPAGEFLYGDDNQKKSLPEFWIDQTPVTNAEYERFVIETNHEPPSHWQGQPPSSALAHHPVVYVSWHYAVAYAEWAGKRLPSEAEWEKAARGSDGRKYPWGEQPPAKHLCNFNRNVGGTTPVGKYSPEGDSAYGCGDMAGNVWEWTASDYDKFSKVLRGGSWESSGVSVRTADHVILQPGDHGNNVGFRCVVSPGNNNE